MCVHYTKRLSYVNTKRLFVYLLCDENHFTSRFLAYVHILSSQKKPELFIYVVFFSCGSAKINNKIHVYFILHFLLLLHHYAEMKRETRAATVVVKGQTKLDFSKVFLLFLERRRYDTVE